MHDDSLLNSLNGFSCISSVSTNNADAGNAKTRKHSKYNTQRNDRLFLAAFLDVGDLLFGFRDISRIKPERSLVGFAALVLHRVVVYTPSSVRGRPIPVV
jgi:hypothetical protein